MKKTLTLLACCLLCALSWAQNTQNTQTTQNAQSPKSDRFIANTQTERLKDHLYYLASDSLRGRQAGSADALRAARYLANQYEEMGAIPLFEDYLMDFAMGERGGMLGMAYSMLGSASNYNNVVIVIPGNDPKLRHEFIVVGGHYDHLGVKNGTVYNGADDNASGASAMVELARNLIAHRSELRRSVVICNFDAEETGLNGSSALAERLAHPQTLHHMTHVNIFESLQQAGMTVTPIDHCKLMLSVDMVGWYKQSGHLQLQGSGTIDNGNKLIERIAKECSINVKLKRFETSVLTATDTEPFAKKGIATLDVTTGLKSPYHKPGDDPELIDYDGLSRVVDFLTELVTEASRESSFAPSGRLAPKHRGTDPLVELGLQIGGARNWFDFPYMAVQSHMGWGWDGGANLLLNLPSTEKNTSFSLRTGLLYDAFKSPFPDSACQTNTYRQRALEIPLELRLNFSKTPYRFYLGAGLYYDIMLQSNAQDMSFRHLPHVDTDPLGVMWTIGMKMGRWDFGVYQKNQINAHQVKALATRAYLSYYFW